MLCICGFAADKIQENVGGHYEPVKNDFRRYRPEYPVQCGSRTIFLCRAAGLCDDVPERHQRSRKAVCHTKRTACHALGSISAVSADVPVYGGQRTSCRCQRLLEFLLDGIH